MGTSGWLPLLMLLMLTPSLHPLFLLLLGPWALGLSVGGQPASSGQGWRE